MFALAVDQSFDRNVFPFVGVVASLGVGQPSETYWKRYATSLSDNTIGNFMTTAIFPAVFHQDPRYFERGTGSVLHRAGYAASRTVLTRSQHDGRRAFNISLIGGDTVTGLLSDIYYPAAQRSAGDTTARIGSQVMWNAIAYECEEFWPDVRRRLQHVFLRHP